jgi:hypothetical protein
MINMIAVMSYQVKSAKNNIEDFHPLVNDPDIIHNQCPEDQIILKDLINVFMFYIYMLICSKKRIIIFSLKKGQ